MEHNVDKSKFEIYKNISNELHIAIKRENVEVIEKIVRQFGDIENVPDKFLTAGIYLQNLGNNKHMLISPEEEAREVEINKLRFNNT